MARVTSLLWEQHCCLPLSPGADVGYPGDAVAAILGGNFRRVAGQVWT